MDGVFDGPTVIELKVIKKICNFYPEQRFVTCENTGCPGEHKYNI